MRNRHNFWNWICETGTDCKSSGDSEHGCVIIPRCWQVLLEEIVPKAHLCMNLLN